MSCRVGKISSDYVKPYVLPIVPYTQCAHFYHIRIYNTSCFIAYPWHRNKRSMSLPVQALASQPILISLLFLLQIWSPPFLVWLPPLTNWRLRFSHRPKRRQHTCSSESLLRGLSVLGSSGFQCRGSRLAKSAGRYVGFWRSLKVQRWRGCNVLVHLMPY